MKSRLQILAACTFGLILPALPSIGFAQTTAPAPTGPGTLPAPTGPLPASGIVDKPIGSDISRMRRLVRDVVSNTDNIRSAGEFGAQLWLTPNADFFLNWRKPETPTLDPVDIVLRDHPIYTVIIFYGEGRTSTGQANISYDISVLRPDGTIYNRRDALVGYQNLAPTDGRELQLGRNYLNINIGPDDPAGIYTVNVTVHDNVSRVDLPLKQTFVVQ